MNKDLTPDVMNSLRDRAEAATRGQSTVRTAVGIPPVTVEHFQALIHELNVHQIELEMQNEELRRIQSALELSRTRYMDLYHHAPVGYIQVSENGMVLESNQTIANWLGESSESVRNQPLSNYIVKGDRNTFYELRRSIFETRESQNCELRLEKRDGARLWVQLSCSLAFQSGSSKTINIALVDISDRKRVEAAHSELESQLRQSQKMEAIGTLAGGIAHDFNNILAVILSNAELASKDTRSPSSIAADIYEIRRAAERARELVKQILAFSRTQPTDRHVIDLAPVIEDSAQLLRSTMPARVSLTVACASDVPKVKADFTQIEQVILNIATNSLHAIQGKRGNIHMRLDTVALAPHLPDAPRLLGKHWAKQNKAVRLLIRDDGTGMPPEILERVFEPFFTSKSADEGTGLGLAVAHGIIQSHDGEIVAESQLGHGATFTIFLPPADQASIELEQRLTPSAMFAGKRNAVLNRTPPLNSESCTILYLDDNIIFVKSICLLLKNYGLNCVGFSDSIAALDAIAACPTAFDIAVTDYNMPGLSGIEVAHKIRSIRPELPVALTSGFIDADLREQAIEAGIRELIAKPFQSIDFLNMLRKLTPQGKSPP